MKYQDSNAAFMPVNLNITNKEILVVGGGSVALNKIQGILNYTKNIRVVALEVCSKIKELNLDYTEKTYEASDIGNAFIVYACTNNKEVNKQVYYDARNGNILVNIADNPPLSNFVSPAVYKKDNMTVAVGSNGQDVKTSIKWRNCIREFLESNPVK